MLRHAGKQCITIFLVFRLSCNIEAWLDASPFSTLLRETIAARAVDREAASARTWRSCPSLIIEAKFVVVGTDASSWPWRSLLC